MTRNDAMNYRVGRYFTMWEFLRSDVALRDEELLKAQLAIPTECIDNIKALCANVLDPLRLEFGSVVIRSGYRCKELNERVGGSPNSQHMRGEAADIVVYPTRHAFRWIAHRLPYDQLIDEYELTWIHVSYRKTGNRRMILAIDKSGTRKLDFNNI